MYTPRPCSSDSFSKVVLPILWSLLGLFLPLCITLHLASSNFNKNCWTVYKEYQDPLVAYSSYQLCHIPLNHLQNVVQILVLNPRTHSHKELDHEVSICSLIPPAMAISIARTKGNNSKGPGPMALIFFPTIQLVILVMCTKFQVSR